MAFIPWTWKAASRKRLRRFSRECAKAEANWNCSALRVAQFACSFRLPACLWIHRQDS